MNSNLNGTTEENKMKKKKKFRSTHFWSQVSFTGRKLKVLKVTICFHSTKKEKKSHFMTPLKET